MVVRVKIYFYPSQQIITTPFVKKENGNKKQIQTYTNVYNSHTPPPASYTEGVVVWTTKKKVLIIACATMWVGFFSNIKNGLSRRLDKWIFFCCYENGTKCPLVKKLWKNENFTFVHILFEQNIGFVNLKTFVVDSTNDVLLCLTSNSSFQYSSILLVLIII